MRPAVQVPPKIALGAIIEVLQIWTDLLLFQSAYIVLDTLFSENRSCQVSEAYEDQLGREFPTVCDCFSILAKVICRVCHYG